MTARTGVMVVGMHRSGTSAVTRVVNLLGVPLGREDDLYAAPDNPSGHWESVSLCALNDVVLGVFGGYDMAMPAMPRGWLGSRSAEHLRAVMDVTFHDVFRNERWLWKDPRLCLTLPLWRQVLRDFCVVLVVRDSEAVVSSLKRREGYPEFYCRGLWDDHNRRAVAACAGLPVVRVHFETLLSAPRAGVEQLADGLRSLGVTLDGDAGAAAASLQTRDAPPPTPSAGDDLCAALLSGPSVQEAYRPPAIPSQPWWVNPSIHAGRAWLRTRERWIDVAPSARG